MACTSAPIGRTNPSTPTPPQHTPPPQQPPRRPQTTVGRLNSHALPRTNPEPSTTSTPYALYPCSHAIHPRERPSLERSTRWVRGTKLVRRRASAPQSYLHCTREDRLFCDGLRFAFLASAQETYLCLHCRLVAVRLLSRLGAFRVHF
jgi:hypothetical protein